MATVQRLTGVNREGVRGIFIRRKPDYIDNMVIGSLAAASTLTVPSGAHIAKIANNAEVWVNVANSAAVFPSANAMVGTAAFCIPAAVGDTFEIGNAVTSISFIAPAAMRLSVEWYK